MSRYSDLIGIPFEYGGRDEQKLDCYGLLKLLYRQDGVELPDYKSPSDMPAISALMLGELRLWEQCELQEGAALMFRVIGGTHVGYYIGNNKFIHTWQASGGVTIERLDDVWQKRLLGVYRYVG